MTRAELIQRIAHKQLHLSERGVEFAVKRMLDQMADCLAGGRRIENETFNTLKNQAPGRVKRKSTRRRGSPMCSGASRNCRTPGCTNCCLALESRPRPAPGRIGRLSPYAVSPSPPDPRERPSRPTVLTGGIHTFSHSSSTVEAPKEDHSAKHRLRRVVLARVDATRRDSPRRRSPR